MFFKRDTSRRDKLSTFIDDKDDRETPDHIFRALNARFRFTLDVAASGHNAKLPRFFSLDDDGLSQSWRGERVWCNPPYSDLSSWVRKASIQEAELCVMLIPANRTDQKWWHRYIEPRRGDGTVWVEFLQGRVRFRFPPGDPRRGRAGDSPPFASCLLVFLGGDAILPKDRQASLDLGGAQC